LAHAGQRALHLQVLLRAARRRHRALVVEVAEERLDSTSTRFGNCLASFFRSEVSASIASSLSTVPFSQEKPLM
jgi:hypothetical protein